MRWSRHPVASLAGLVGRNILGAACLVAGILMLALPGQGFLTMFVGVMLLSFPGKCRLERWIVSRGPLLSAINWLRKRKGRVPLEVGE